MKENEYVICQVLISQGSFVREMSLPVYPIYSDDIRHFREEGVDDPVWHPPHVVASVFLPKINKKIKKSYFTAIKEDMS